MKNFLAFALILVSANSALASGKTFPKVETTCLYKGEARFSNDYEPIKLVLTLKSIDSNGIGNLKGFLESKSKMSEILVSMQIPSFEEITSIISDCEKHGGIKELTTVSAGSFHSCKIYQSGHGYNWIAQVPFGSIKVELDSRPMKYELESCTEKSSP